MPAWLPYTWNESARQFKDELGKHVKRKEVRNAIDDVVDAAVAIIGLASLKLQAGETEIADWQESVESEIKTSHIAVAAIAAGGWLQATSDVWIEAGNRIKTQFDYLRDFAQELEDGLPLDGQFLSRARMYGVSATGTYESILRRGDILSGVTEERRLLGSVQPCHSCSHYAALGWQPVGTLPDIGEACECKSACRCSWQRRRSNGKPLGDSPMPKLNFDEDRCRRRNRLAALRDGVDSVPVTFLEADDPEITKPKGFARGSLPSTAADEMKRINTLLPDGAKPLARDQVHIHYIEAANSSYIPDRSAFLDRSTLKNIATDAAAGFAFMNSHRTGGLSTPTELPFGRTFCGRFESVTENGMTVDKAMVGLYMLKGSKPNGDHGPSTDTLHEAICAGTIFDVSIGLAGGHGCISCDVCGHDMESGHCPHMPGTSMGMNIDEMTAQEARGIPGGVCSYTLTDCRPGEVSAVFNGAVPGAGFRKAKQLAKAGKFNAANLSLVKERFGSLAEPGDFGSVPKPDREDRSRNHPQKGNVMNLSDLLKFWKAAGEPDNIDLDSLSDLSSKSPAIPAPVAASVAWEQSDAYKALSAQNAELKSRADAADSLFKEAKVKADADRLAALDKDALAFADKAVLEGKIVPASRDNLAASYKGLAGSPETLNHFTAHIANLPGHKLTSETIVSDLPPGSKALENEPSEKIDPDRIKKLASMTPMGHELLG